MISLIISVLVLFGKGGSQCPKIHRMLKIESAILTALGMRKTGMSRVKSLMRKTNPKSWTQIIEFYAVGVMPSLPVWKMFPSVWPAVRNVGRWSPGRA